MRKKNVAVFLSALAISSALALPALAASDPPKNTNPFVKGTASYEKWEEIYQKHYGEWVAANPIDAATVANKSGKGATTVTSTRKSNYPTIGNCKEWVNIRDGAGAQYPSLGQLKLGTPVTIVRWNSDKTWAFITYDDGNRGGWVAKEFIVY